MRATHTNSQRTFRKNQSQIKILCFTFFNRWAVTYHRIIQDFIMREQTGALAPPSSDEHKVRHSRRHGIMASVFSGTRQHSHEVNLELSVEMNRKMQSVLEDTLLKNITLKVTH